MRQPWRFSWWWVVGGAVAALAGAAAIARQSIAQQHALFETDARIVHRLLSQQVVQHDAILATLALLQPAPAAPGTGSPEQRLPALYPRILSVQRSDATTPWPDPSLAEAERRSRQSGRAALAPPDLPSGRYRLVLAAVPASYALTIDLQALVPWAEWPMAAGTSAVRVELVHSGQRHVIQPGRLQAGTGSVFEFHKLLAAESQPFDVVATQSLGWRQWPWARMLAWVLAVAALLAVARHLQRQRTARRRAEELLRLGQVARLNTLGELAAGMAHELNQPLTAVLANTQAAQRLLDDDPPELATARGAMAQAAAQARRAAEVVGRLRRAVERPDSGDQRQAMDMADAVRRALYLLEPECLRRGVAPTLEGAPALAVMADPVALDQIVHNLILNALQALEQVPAAQRRLTLNLRSVDGRGELSVADSGPGIPPDVLPRLFEPFFSTREGGLGLGLSLCETLASGMDGSISAANAATGGAVFRLRLPLAVDQA
ncbi:sensor histidine kinase [Hydrogenophaga sp. PBL-H3]|uniref:sensor histidine kinase n=1 Tax=Hydrogenophaga sp. PBL-H3 TaxID=434010 RepID=UPI001320153B|nr:ATP-binding protein [Hydrogenophaga sp. PBL-H3]QHE77854.1 two-component sensor histidine kinase [Hydrogenophaga sp. PBL-H3]QHE82278.1 two-component sensor histidine kinase [Hydrogenophaga sp. PBL-H3]